MQHEEHADICEDVDQATFERQRARIGLVIESLAHRQLVDQPSDVRSSGLASPVSHIHCSPLCVSLAVLLQCERNIRKSARSGLIGDPPPQIETLANIIHISL